MSNYPMGVGNYFEEEAAQLREREWVWGIIIEDIGEGPYYEIDGRYYSKKEAIEVLNKEYGEGEYELEDWKVDNEEVYENYLGEYL